MTAASVVLAAPSGAGAAVGERIGHTALGQLAAPDACMARGSRSFHFAATLMRAAERERVARVYTWCRITDDLADDASLVAADAEARIDAWMHASRAAYDGHATGIPLLDRVMGEMAERRIPFAYAAALGEGVRSDLRFVHYETMAELAGYAHRVAGVVGQWLCELHDVRDPWLLGRAAALGRGMQLTNILRDVGEDWDQRRLYLPRQLLARHGLAEADVGAMRRGERPRCAAYRALLEEMMAVAERDYAAAREAIPLLPPGFRRSVAVAAAVYAGIHDAIRRNDYDNLGRRAVTTSSRKLVLAAGALWGAWRTRVPARVA